MRVLQHWVYPIPAYRVFLDPVAQLTDDLLETICDLCRHEAVNPLQMYFFSYILPYSLLASPNFLIEETILGGSLAYKKMWNVVQSFLLFLQIVIPRRSFASSPRSQRIRTPEELFPPGCLHRINPRQEIGKGLRSCHHCNPERLFGLRMLVGGPPFRDMRGTRLRRHALRVGCPWKLERCRHKDTRPHDPKLRIDINKDFNFLFWQL
jgi:hypothetical protein